MRRSLWKEIVAINLCGLLTTIQAADIAVNGFASIVGGMTLDKDDTYLVDPSSGATYDDNFSLQPESIIGLQLDVDLTNDVKFTTQMLARGGNDFDIILEWAYLTYHFTPNFSGQIGRMRTPFFSYSNALDVGLSYPWIRPPMDVYWPNVTSFDAAKLNYATTFDTWDVSINLFSGTSNFPINQGAFANSGATVENPVMAGMSLELNRDWLSLRGSFTHVEIDLRNIPVSQPDNSVISVDLSNQARYYNLFSKIDYNNVLLMAEGILLTYDNKSFNLNTEVDWYITSGYRFGKILPHFTISKRREDDDVHAATRKITSETFGVRWDLLPAAALKFEYTHTDEEDTLSDNATEVLSAAVDFVF